MSYAEMKRDVIQLIAKHGIANMVGCLAACVEDICDDLEIETTERDEWVELKDALDNALDRFTGGRC